MNCYATQAFIFMLVLADLPSMYYGAETIVIIRNYLKQQLYYKVEDDDVKYVSATEDLKLSFDEEETSEVKVKLCWKGRKCFKVVYFQVFDGSIKKEGTLGKPYEWKATPDALYFPSSSKRSIGPFKETLEWETVANEQIDCKTILLVTPV